MTMLEDSGFYPTDFVRKSAIISPCGKYRYRLERRWNDVLPLCLWIGLNPSTADAETDDATIRRMCSFAKSWNCGGIVVVNLFAYRSTDPNRLKTAADSVGPENDANITQAAEQCPLIVACWGAGGRLHHRDVKVLHWLQKTGKAIQCLGVTREGCPKHPVRLAANTQLVKIVDYS